MVNDFPLQIEVSPVVSKAGQLLLSRINELALCIAYPESAVLSGLPITKTERKEKVFESSVRFSSKECGYPSLSVKSVVFSVNKPIMLHGVTAYGGTDTSYQYKMSLTKVRVSHVTVRPCHGNGITIIVLPFPSHADCTVVTILSHAGHVTSYASLVTSM